MYQLKKYGKTIWRDHIVDIEAGTVIQEGTRFTASRANNIEDAIEYLVNERQPKIDDEFTKMRLQIEMMGRAPVNNGTFFEQLSNESPKATVLQYKDAVLQKGIELGATSLQLDVVPFLIGEFVTIFDDTNMEHVQVTSIENNNIITIAATVNAYKKGAFVKRTTAAINRNLQTLTISNWSTYSVKVEVV